MRSEDLSSDSWAEWLQHPATKALREWATEQLEDRKQRWADGEFTASFTNEMIARNAGATGACSVYVQIEEMDYQLIIEGRNDAKK